MSFGFLHGGLFEGELKTFLETGHIRVQIFLLLNYFVDAKLTSNRMVFEGQANFR